MQGDSGRRRLDDPEDFVRLEIATALARDITVIPVLVDGARIPPRNDLPENIAGLPDHQYSELSNRNWNQGADRLVRLIRRKLAERDEARRVKKKTAAAPATTLAKRRGRVMWVALAAFLMLAGGLLWLSYVSTTSVSQADLENLPQAQASPIEASHARPPEVVKNSIGMEFVWIPPGDFMMGSEHGESDEKPIHLVNIGKGFYLGGFEVTQAQWKAVMGADHNPSFSVGDDLPVEHISLADAKDFITSLQARDNNYRYRLPTEAEWEYAARAGATGDYPDNLDAVAWYDINSGGKSHPVGKGQPNGFGLFDMQGNVWEWCQDVYHKTYDHAPSDGGAWKKGGEQMYGVARGGAWHSPAALCRFAERDNQLPFYDGGSNGLRVVADAKP
jgi:formylglycine-generating enzyme required for sulfatase activity